MISAGGISLKRRRGCKVKGSHVSRSTPRYATLYIFRKFETVQRKTFSLSLFFFKLARYFLSDRVIFLRISMGYSRQIVVFRVHPSKPRGDPVARRVQRNRSLDGRHLSALSAQMTLLNHRSATPWTPGGLPVLAPCSVSTTRSKPAADY